ncbi:hypothetical protein ACWEO4_39795 [Streptomyces sp. NPDC004393]
MPALRRRRRNGGGTTRSSHGSLFVLDGTGPAGAETRIHALSAAAADPVLAGFLRQVLTLATQLTDLLQHGPSASVWRPVQDPAQRVGWMHSAHP